MTVAPFELQGVAANRFNILQHDQQRHILTFQSPHTRPFIDTGRTGAVQAKMTNGIDAVVPVAPLNAEYPLVQPGQIFWFKLCVSHEHWFLSDNHIKGAKKSTGGMRFPATTVTYPSIASSTSQRTCPAAFSRVTIAGAKRKAC